MGDYLVVSYLKNFEGKYDKEDVLSVSGDYGIVNQIDFQGRSFAGKSVLNYGIVGMGDIVYTKSPLKKNPFGIIKTNKLNSGIVSTLYAIYTPKKNCNAIFVEHYFELDSRLNEYLKPLVNKGAKNDMKVSSEKALDGNIIFPAIEEQKRISAFLEFFGRYITLHQRKLEHLKLKKKSLLQKLFPKEGEVYPELRFPGFTDPWEQRKLGELTVRVKGNDGRMELPTLTISAAEGWLDQHDRFSTNIAGNEQRNYTLLHRGELSYNHGNSKIAKYGVVFVLSDYTEALVPKVYHSFKVKNNNCNPYFIEYYFATKRPDKELCKLISSGARMDGLLNIGYEDFVNIAIKIPLLTEQRLIVECLNKVNTLLTLHQ